MNDPLDSSTQKISVKSERKKNESNYNSIATKDQWFILAKAWLHYSNEKQGKYVKEIGYQRTCRLRIGLWKYLYVALNLPNQESFMTHWVFKSLLTTPSNVLPFHLKQTFLPIIWIFAKDEGDGIESRLPFRIFSTLGPKNLGLFGNVLPTVHSGRKYKCWVEISILAMFGKTSSKYSINEKMSFKLTAISPAKNNFLYQFSTRYPSLKKLG